MASYDLLIIGAGPAAWSCAMTARQRGLTTAVACAQSATSWLQRAERIDNYPGLPQISGKELLSRFRAQAADMGVVIIEQLARQIMPSGDIYMTLVGNDIIESRAIVLAMGAARPKLLPGEEDLLGRGVSWCGTCDGMFYRALNQLRYKQLQINSPVKRVENRTENHTRKQKYGIGGRVQQY